MPQVRVVTEPERPIAIIAATTNWREFPMLWPQLLDEVHADVRWQGNGHTGRNVMLYLDDVPHVEIGVELDQPVGITGRVIRSALPSGKVATMTHRGPHDRLGATHDAIRAFCAEHSLALAGPRWEVYGHSNTEPAQLETDVYYLLR
jgi:effector-binding domain-containing protein